MLAEREKIQGIGVLRLFVLMIGVASAIALAALSAGPTLGQTNIDQGKPASELFANYCAVCHKSTRGLANGRNSFMLSLFLREHYAASSQQAAALAAYVISAGGNAPAAKPARSEEAKGQDAKGHETKPRAASASPKSEPEKRGGQAGPEDATPAQQEAAPIVAAPAAGAPPSAGQVPELRPTTSAGVESQSNDGAPVPRDNIPD